MERDRELFAKFIGEMDVIRTIEGEENILGKASKWMDRVSQMVLVGVGLGLLGMVNVVEFGYDTVSKTVAWREKLLREIEGNALTDD